MDSAIRVESWRVGGAARAAASASPSARTNASGKISISYQTRNLLYSCITLRPTGSHVPDSCVYDVQGLLADAGGAAYTYAWHRYTVDGYKRKRFRMPNPLCAQLCKRGGPMMILSAHTTHTCGVTLRSQHKKLLSKLTIHQPCLPRSS